MIEVMSPAPRIGGFDERVSWFANYGVRECWLIHHLVRDVEVISFDSQSVARRQLFEPDQRIESLVLPQFDSTPSTMLPRDQPFP